MRDGVLSIGSLFSGIGGLELGLEWAGLGPVLWQVEKDEFCRRVLAKHWPEVPRYEDVRSVRASQLPVVDIICGGFPCQDVSSAGIGGGLSAPRSGLWFEFWRIVKESSPRFVVVENVASGKARWLRRVRHHLHMLGYRTRSLGIAARDVGAPHNRKRVFVVAYSDAELGEARDGHQQDGAGPLQPSGSGECDTPSWAFLENRSQTGGDADGVPRRMDRVASLGNAVVPQCAQVVGEVIRQMLQSGQS